MPFFVSKTFNGIEAQEKCLKTKEKLSARGATMTVGVHETKITVASKTIAIFLIFIGTLSYKELPNGLRYLRWGGDGEAVQPEK